MGPRILRRKLDSRRRMTLPRQPGETMFLADTGKVIIITTDAETAKKIAKKAHEVNKEAKLKALEEWFSLVKRSGLSTITPEDIEKRISAGILREEGGAR